jgi:hypothetical protein
MHLIFFTGENNVFSAAKRSFAGSKNQRFFEVSLTFRFAASKIADLLVKIQRIFTVSLPQNFSQPQIILKFVFFIKNFCILKI